MTNDVNESIIKNLFKQITKVIDYKINSLTQVKSAIVDSVNPDGTVNIKIPPDSTVYTRVLNQSIYQTLQPGDSVKIIKQDNNLSNMWIIGKHNSPLPSFYPVGSIYCAGTLQADPSQYFDGTWNLYGKSEIIGENVNVESDEPTYVYYWIRID